MDLLRKHGVSKGVSVDLVAISSLDMLVGVIAMLKTDGAIVAQHHLESTIQDVLRGMIRANVGVVVNNVASPSAGRGAANCGMTLIHLHDVGLVDDVVGESCVEFPEFNDTRRVHCDVASRFGNGGGGV